jgi:hypothetical protein
VAVEARQHKRGELERLTLIVCHRAGAKALRAAFCRPRGLFASNFLSNLEAKDSLCWAMFRNDFS